MELLISIIVGVALIEAYAWLPSLSEWLVTKAASLVPIIEQDRCRGEWTATLETLPNSFIRLLHALSLLLLGAPRIRSDFREQALEELDTTILALAELEVELDWIAQPLSARVEEFAQGVEERKLSLSFGGLLATLAKLNDTARNKLPPSSAQDFAQALNHCRKVTEAQNELLLEAFTAERQRLHDDVIHFLTTTEAMAEVLRRHVPVFDALRASELPLRKWEVALDKACDDFQAELDACTGEFNTAHASFSEPHDNNIDYGGDWAEFDAAFAALKTLNSSIVASIRSQKAAKSASTHNAAG